MDAGTLTQARWSCNVLGQLYVVNCVQVQPADFSTGVHPAYVTGVAVAVQAWVSPVNPWTSESIECCRFGSV